MTKLSIVIPTYRRGNILLATIRHLMELPVRANEILIVDQTSEYLPDMTRQIQALEGGIVRRIVLPEPSIPQAMNAGLQEARAEIVLFLDDDIIPDERLISSHLNAYAEHLDVCAVAGQVLQPEDDFRPADFTPRCSRSPLRSGLDFKFNGTRPAWVDNVMAGNLSVRRERALSIGGFDANFVRPVAFRFETEFAKRLVAAGGKILFEPSASVKHLRMRDGGTRSIGSHLGSASPLHGVGDYYYALRCGRGYDRLTYILRRPFREVCTRFHLRHPWWIPVKFVGELRAIILAIKLHRQGPKLLTP